MTKSIDNPAILYVDDDRPNLSIFRVLFRRMNIITTTSAIEGLELLISNENIKIVLSDLRMPEMDGLEFIETARQSHPDLIYAIVSGSDLGDRIKIALDNGVISEHIRKPFDMDAVNQSMQNLLAIGFK